MGVTVDNMKLEVEFSTGVWTDVMTNGGSDDDTVASAGLKLSYGISGNGPKDRIAKTGMMKFALRNDAANSGSAQGYYSPNHGSVRTGFNYGTKVRLVLSEGGTDYYKFCGKLKEINPDPGSTGRQWTRCTAVDWMDEAADETLRALGPFPDKTADEIITSIVGAMPTAAQPAATSYDTGSQEFPRALFDMGVGTSAMRAIARVVMSEFGYLAVIGDTTQGGLLRFWNRHARASVSSSATLSNTMVKMKAPSSLSKVYNRVEVTTHPTELDGENETVVFSYQGPNLVLAPSEVRTLWIEYRDPDNRDDLIGALNGQGAAKGNSDPDDNDLIAEAPGGSDVSSSIGSDYTFYASAAKVTLTNSSGGFATVTKLQGRARGIYDTNPVTAETTSTQGYGSRSIKIDMPYQHDQNIGQGLADFIDAQYSDLGGQITSVKFLANDSQSLLDAALQVEPGDKVTITETATGLSSVSAFVNSVKLTIEEGQWIECEWGLAPDVESGFFILDTDVLDTGVLGYA